jgi:dephospho-CoA kinase
VVARNGFSPAEVRAIMAVQIDREHRLAAADDVLHNAGTLDAIAPQVEALDRRYRELATASRAST